MNEFSEFKKTEKQVRRMWRLSPRKAQLHLAALIAVKREKKQRTSNLEWLALQLMTFKQLVGENATDRRRA